MENIVSPNERAFMIGMWIAENTVRAQEIIHKVKHHKGKSGIMIMNLDLMKAYDRMGCKFIDLALKAWGFSIEARKLITSYVMTVNY